MADAAASRSPRTRLPYRRQRRDLRPSQAARITALLAIALVAGLTATLAAPLYPDASEVEVGRPAPRDFQAPRSATFDSTVLTQRERQRAADAVLPIAARTDPRVATQQVQAANRGLELIEVIRQDNAAGFEQEAEDLRRRTELAALPQGTLRQLEELDPETWAKVRSEVPTVVAQTLREPVRPDTLPIARGAAISYVERSIDTETSALIAQTASAFIVPNTTVDASQTEAARQAAAAAVRPVEQRIAAGQVILRQGDIVTPETAEALEHLGLLRGTFGWREIAGTLLFVLVLVGLAIGTLARLRPGLWRHPRRVALTVLLVVVFAFGSRYVIPDHRVLAYAYPAPAVGMTVTALLGLETGVITSFVVAAALATLGGTGLEMFLYVLAGSLAGSVALGRVERLSAFIAAGGAVALGSVATILAFRLPGPSLDVRGVSELAAAALANAALSTGLTAMGFVAAGTLGITTTLQLMELARPDHRLLRELQLKAPGTYHHSILITNLAEAAAQAIGADTLLVRVGAYYHDVGKSVRPYFFVENQVPGTNPHEGLDAHASARIVIAHVTDGVDLCVAYGIPDAVIDFVRQHHGTTIVEYFYRQAIDLLGEEAVDIEAFRYPGPKPQSREAAILMLADGSEAAVRAASPETREQIREIVNKIIRRRLNGGELDDSNLTLRDLNVIRESFVSAFQSHYHPRIKYPDDLPTAAPRDVSPRIAMAAADDTPVTPPAGDGAGDDEHAASPIVAEDSDSKT